MQIKDMTMDSMGRRLARWYFSKDALPYWCIFLLDSLIVMASGYLAIYQMQGALTFVFNFWPKTGGLLISLACFTVFFRLFHTYSGTMRYSSFVDLSYLAIASALGSITTMLLYFLFDKLNITSVLMPDPLIALEMFVVSTLLMILSRVVAKTIFDNMRADENTRKAFIFGTHQGGVSLAKAINSQTPKMFELAGFISPDDVIETEYLMGVKVHNANDALLEFMKLKGVNCVIVSPLQVQNFRNNEEFVENLIEANVKIFIMPDAEEWDGKTDLKQRSLREIQIEDLLPREPITLDMEGIAAQLRDKCILITGAAGSIGSEMVRQVAKFHPSALVLVDQAETPMHDIRLMMARDFAFIKTETVVSSITDEEYMERLFEEYRPEYVFHAAAYKHVPMMEDNPVMAVKNNVRGTRVIADLAVKYGTRKFVMISTDKAVNPTNVMGCSKRICEIYCQALNRRIQEGSCPIKTVPGITHQTQFITTRFGNVLGSSGSVIPIFKEQIAKGGPITVTHPDIIRYFMLIPEACKLVLEAGTMGKGGEIFVFEMGKAVKIVDLAKRMIQLSGATDVEIKFTGLRDGEKLYEEVLASAENTLPTVHPKIMVAKVRESEYDQAVADEERLMAVSHSLNKMEVVRVMKEIVPEYKSKHSVYEVLDEKKN